MGSGGTNRSKKKKTTKKVSDVGLGVDKSDSKKKKKSPKKKKKSPRITDASTDNSLESNDLSAALGEPSGSAEPSKMRYRKKKQKRSLKSDYINSLLSRPAGLEAVGTDGDSGDASGESSSSYKCFEECMAVLVQVL